MAYRPGSRASGVAGLDAGTDVVAVVITRLSDTSIDVSLETARRHRIARVYRAAASHVVCAVTPAVVAGLTSRDRSASQVSCTPVSDVVVVGLTGCPSPGLRDTR